MVFLLAACSQPVDFCEGTTRLDYAPAPDAPLTTFPDDHWLVDDPSTFTGYRVELNPDTSPGLGDFPDNYANWFQHLSTLDGFGLTAGISFLLNGDPLTELADEDVLVAARTDAGWEPVPVETLLLDDGWAVMLRPRVALPEDSDVVALVLTDPASAGCIQPSNYLAELLDPDGRDVEDHAMGPRFREALEGVDIPPERVAAMTVFHTQAATPQSLQVAEFVQTLDPELVFGVCEDRGHLACDGTLDVVDFRNEERVVPPGDVEERGRYDLPVRLWMPPGEGPWPTVVCGHGLGGDRYDCEALVDEVTALGVALIGVDAVEHGDHPTRSEGDLELIEPLLIFAISVTPPGLHALRLRDNFRQSAWDKLQLIRALALGVDVDGDGALDLDPDHLAYAGVSLGALMGPEPLALSEDLSGGWLAVGGGRVTQIISDSPSFSILIDVMKPSNYSDGDVLRGMQFLQTVIEAGDPMVWASHVQADRRVGGPVPDIYLGAVLNDEVVPNSTNDNLARAFFAPGIGTEHWPVAEMTFGPGSVQANGPGGATLGYVQHATVVRDGTERAATHAHLHDSDEGLAAIEALLAPGLFDEGAGVVLDPDE